MQANLETADAGSGLAPYPVQAAQLGSIDFCMPFSVVEIATERPAEKDLFAGCTKIFKAYQCRPGLQQTF